MDIHINYWRYALEIEKAGSIRKAADNLYMGQPNLSRALSELEESIGIRIFERSSQGVRPTKDGEEFLICARSVLRHIEDVEKRFHPDLKSVQSLHIQVPRGGYVSQALADLLNELDDTHPIDIQCEEAVSADSIQNVIRAQANLAVVRFHQSELSYYINLFKENNIVYKKIWEYDYVVTVSASDPLAGRKRLALNDLKGYREIIHAHRTANLFLPESENGAAPGDHLTNQKLYVNDRSNQLFVIKSVPKTFMWGAPFSTLCEPRDGLVQIPFDCDNLHYHEGVIRRHNYHPTPLENRLIELITLLVRGQRS